MRNACIGRSGDPSLLVYHIRDQWVGQLRRRICRTQKARGLDCNLLSLRWLGCIHVLVESFCENRKGKHNVSLDDLEIESPACDLESPRVQCRPMN